MSVSPSGFEFGPTGTSLTAGRKHRRSIPDCISQVIKEYCLASPPGAQLT
jgi:hypothetical protein